MSFYHTARVILFPALGGIILECIESPGRQSVVASPGMYETVSRVSAGVPRYWCRWFRRCKCQEGRSRRRSWDCKEIGDEGKAAGRSNGDANAGKASGAQARRDHIEFVEVDARAGHRFRHHRHQRLGVAARHCFLAEYDSLRLAAGDKHRGAANAHAGIELRKPGTIHSCIRQVGDEGRRHSPRLPSS